ncbi:MAG: hypothetical protein QM662_04830 [Gordonia sp. (in: high G+C Gram-positive bacteria)]
MRTTVDLPDGLMRAAKVAAAERGITLKELFETAVQQEVGTSTAVTRGRVRLPLVGTTAARIDLAGAEIEEIFAAEDAEKYTR